MRGQDWIEVTEDGRAIGECRDSEYGWEIRFAGGADGPFPSKEEANEALRRVKRCRNEGSEAFQAGKPAESPYKAGTLEANAWWLGYNAAKRADESGPASVSMEL